MSDGAAGKVVHLHGDGKVLQVVEELKEGPELVERDALQEEEARENSSEYGGVAQWSLNGFGGAVLGWDGATPSHSITADGME